MKDSQNDFMDKRNKHRLISKEESAVTSSQRFQPKFQNDLPQWALPSIQTTADIAKTKAKQGGMHHKHANNSHSMPVNERMGTKMSAAAKSGQMQIFGGLSSLHTKVGGFEERGGDLNGDLNSPMLPSHQMAHGDQTAPSDPMGAHIRKPAHLYQLIIKQQILD
jgi:hypothetical protein